MHWLVQIANLVNVVNNEEGWHTGLIHKPYPLLPTLLLPGSSWTASSVISRSHCMKQRGPEARTLATGGWRLASFAILKWVNGKSYYFKLPTFLKNNSWHPQAWQGLIHEAVQKKHGVAMKWICWHITRQGPCIKITGRGGTLVRRGLELGQAQYCCTCFTGADRFYGVIAQHGPTQQQIDYSRSQTCSWPCYSMSESMKVFRPSI